MLIRLTKEMNPLADTVLKLLPQEDVKIALQDRRSSRTPTTSITDNESHAILSEDTKISSEENSKPAVSPDK